MVFHDLWGKQTLILCISFITWFVGVPVTLSLVNLAVRCLTAHHVEAEETNMLASQLMTPCGCSVQLFYRCFSFSNKSEKKFAI